MLPLALYNPLTTDICFFLLMPGTQRLSRPVSGGLVRGKQCEDELNPLFSRRTLEMSGSVTCFLSSGGLKGKLWLEVSPVQGRQRKHTPKDRHTCKHMQAIRVETTDKKCAHFFVEDV